MAIHIKNETTCALCGKIIYSNENPVLFPAFISNIKDKMFIFNDASIHEDCLIDNELAKKAFSLSRLFIKSIKTGNRKCIISGKPIENYQDYIFTGIITSDENEDIFKYNMLTFDKRNLSKWADRKDFLLKANGFLKENKWLNIGKTNILEYFIKIMSEFDNVSK